MRADSNPVDVVRVGWDLSRNARRIRAAWNERESKRGLRSDCNVRHSHQESWSIMRTVEFASRFVRTSLCVGVACVVLCSTAANAQIAPIPEPTPVSDVRTPGWLGVALEDANDGSGAEIRRVIPGAPADRAQLRRGQVITAVQDVPARSADEVISLVSAQPAGVQIRISLRDGSNLDVELDARPADLGEIAQRLVGRPIPHVLVEDVRTGGLIPLHASTGTVTLIEFWATWCGPCHMSIPGMRAIRAHYGAEELRIIAVTDEDADTVLPFIVEAQLSYDVALDLNDDANAAMWVPALPTWFLVDADGTILAVESGMGGLTRLVRPIESAIEAARRDADAPPHEP